MPLLFSVMSKNNNSFTFPMLLLDRHYNFSWKEKPNLKLTCSIMGAKGFFSVILKKIPIWMWQVEIFHFLAFSKPSRALCHVFSRQALPTNELEVSSVPKFTFEVLGYFKITVYFSLEISDRVLGLPYWKFIYFKFSLKF